MKNQGNHRASERGSVFFWIFILIALLVGLTALLNQGTRTGETTLSSEQARLASAEILGQANILKNAYRQLRIKGCDSTLISYANTVHTDVTYYPNPSSAPSDKSCHLFEQNGGNAKYVDFTRLRTTGVTIPGFSYALLSIEKVGTTAKEDVLVLSHLPDMLCETINFQLHGQKKRYVSSSAFGNILKSGDDIAESSCPDCSGKPAGCVYNTTNNNNNLYFTLEAR